MSPHESSFLTVNPFETGNIIEYDGRLEPVMYITLHVVMKKHSIIFLQFTRNSEDSASEFIENLE